MRSSSKSWLRRQQRDPYVRAARKAGYRSRAAFKLRELATRFSLCKPGDFIIDLGAAPGGWSEVAAQLTTDKGLVIACDLQEMAPICGVKFVRGDCMEEETMIRILELLAGRRADLVLSDLSPAISGVRACDQAATMQLAEGVLECARRSLRPGGNCLVKLFQGAGFADWLQQARREFAQVQTCKPAASRSDSREQYALARGFQRADSGH